MTASLPYGDMMTREEKLRRFFLKAEAWGWRRAFAALSKNDLLITDSEVLAALKSAYRKPPCEVALRGDHIAGLGNVTGTVYCLCLEGEYQLVRQLRAHRPDIKVVSLTYDVMPLTRLPEKSFPTEQIMPSGKSVRRRNMIVALSGADVDYLALVFAQNGRLQVNETLGGALYWWCMLCADLRLLRILDGYVSTHPKGILSFEGNFLYLMLQQEAALLTWLSDWLEKSDVSLLYLNARDKCRLAALQALLDEVPVTSLWSRSESFVETLADKKINMPVCKNILEEALLVEAFLERNSASVEAFKLVTLEEFVSTIDAVCPAISTFFNNKNRLKLSRPDWLQRYKVLPNLFEAHAQLRSTLWQLLK